MSKVKFFDKMQRIVKNSGMMCWKKLQIVWIGKLVIYFGYFMLEICF